MKKLLKELISWIKVGIIFSIPIIAIYIAEVFPAMVMVLGVPVLIALIYLILVAEG